MTIYLDGGEHAHDDPGRGSARRAGITRFLAEAAARSGAPPRIALTGPAEAAGLAPRWREVLLAAGAGEITLAFGGAGGEQIELTALTTADAILVPAGPARACLAALNPIAPDLRRLVAEGTPYYGAGAGARIASEAAVLGGSSIGGVRVAREHGADGNGEVALGQGLGLADLTILTSAIPDTLGLAIAAVEAGMSETILAIDEDAVLVISSGALELIGTGSAWHVRPGETQGVLVSSMQAADGTGSTGTAGAAGSEAAA